MTPARTASKSSPAIADWRRCAKSTRKARPPKVPCILRAVDDQTADALALAENFVREPMHAIDEAEAFAHLAREEAKGIEAIAAEFGVSQPYVRQRMKLATLTDPVKAAYRQGAIDTATA